MERQIGMGGMDSPLCILAAKFKLIPGNTGTFKSTGQWGGCTVGFGVFFLVLRPLAIEIALMERL